MCTDGEDGRRETGVASCQLLHVRSSPARCETSEMFLKSIGPCLMLKYSYTDETHYCETLMVYDFSCCLKCEYRISLWNHWIATERRCLDRNTGIIWFYDWGILWLIAFYDYFRYFPNPRSQMPLSTLLSDLILWLGWLDFLTIFHQIWGETVTLLV